MGVVSRKDRCGKYDMVKTDSTEKTKSQEAKPVDIFGKVEKQ
jgi:hypothetical protein